jgi:vitamin B12 transporter
MKSLSAVAGLAGLASLGAHAQIATLAAQASLDPIVVTATRSVTPANTLREAVVITREDLESSGALSLAEVLQRRAGIELRATGGPGQPVSLFVRGAGSQGTLVLVDGLRVGSATVGTTAIENIPLDMIERIEVVKGPLSSLYGAEAMGGVIQIFTRGRGVPHLFGAASYGTDDDTRVSAGVYAEEGGTRFALSAGARRVDAASATNPRATFSFNPDRDRYENAFFNLRAAQKVWTGEDIVLEAFSSKGRTHFDSGPATDDRNEQTISGAKLTSSSRFSSTWLSKVVLGEGRDRIVTSGSLPGEIETRQDQASWLNEFDVPGGTALVGVETLRQKVLSDENTPFTQTKRNTDSAFVALTQAYSGQRIEASFRYDDDSQFGGRNTGSASYGFEWPSYARISGTYARGFRAPTFYDLYGPSFPGFYEPNPNLQPEESRTYEIAVKSVAQSRVQWRVTAFDNRFENLIVYSAAQTTVLNVGHARSRGLEAEIDLAWFGIRWRGSFTAQRPRDEDTGFALQGRAERYGSFDAARTWGAWTVGIGVVASGERFDSTNEAPASRLPGYALIDARVRYKFAKYWSAEVTGTNLADKKYESAVGYDAPRRAVLLTVRFDAF